MREIFDDLKNTIWQDDRVLAFRRLAEEEGFDLHDRERFGNQEIGIKGFQLFKGKRGKRLKSVLYKTERNSSLKTRIYDYAYFGDSKTRTTTVIEFYLPQWNFSEMLIRPKSNLHKMKAFFGKQRMLFPEVAHFHKAYHIYAPNAENLKYELNEEFVDLMAEQKRIWMEANGNFILFYIKRKPIPLGQLMETYEFAQDLLEVLIHGHSSEEYV
ncbi:MAG: hypothetical protein AB8G86_06975 [Saprospiraceae bacterium]